MSTRLRRGGIWELRMDLVCLGCCPKERHASTQIQKSKKWGERVKEGKKSCKGEAGRREKRREELKRNREEWRRKTKRKQDKKKAWMFKESTRAQRKGKGRTTKDWMNCAFFSGLESPWDRKTGWASLPYWPVCNSCTKNNSAISVGDWREGVMNTRKVTTATAKQRTSIKKLRAGPPFLGCI